MPAPCGAGKDSNKAGATRATVFGGAGARDNLDTAKIDTDFMRIRLGVRDGHGADKADFIDPLIGIIWQVFGYRHYNAPFSNNTLRAKMDGGKSQCTTAFCASTQQSAKSCASPREAARQNACVFSELSPASGAPP